MLRYDCLHFAPCPSNSRLTRHCSFDSCEPFKMPHKSGKKQKLTPYNVFILMFCGLGSLTYGYTASIIGTTLGLYLSSQILCPHLTDFLRPTNFHQILRSDNWKWHRSHINNEWSLPSRWRDWDTVTTHGGRQVG
jgi:hypothetical protein